MSDAIVSRCENHIGIITLNRTNALNALNLSMILALQQQLGEWKNDSNIHAVIISSACERAFCAGGDVRAVYQLREHVDQSMAFFAHEYRLNRFISEFGKPYIALMDGITMGGGVGISLHGSHPVASERFVFAMPETGIGFYPDIGASYFLSRMPGFFGVYLGLTGARLSAADAYAQALVKYVIPSTNFPTVLASLQEADLSVHAHEEVNRVLDEHEMAHSQTANSAAIQTAVASCFQYNNLDLILNALQQLNDDWSRGVLNTLAQKAPLSLEVTLRQLQKAKSMTLVECLDMDYQLTQHFMQGVDFYEGVRALLVDKDNTPHWQSSSPEKVWAYFN